MKPHRILVFCALLPGFALGATTVSAATPTAIPGGANQTSGVTGTLTSVPFNGILRLRAMSLRDAVAADNVHANAPGERPLVFRAIVSNGTHHENHGFFNATLADANGITVTGRPLDDGWSLEQGAAARTSIAFSVPAGFVPEKLVLTEAAMPNAKAFRITLRATDLPAEPKAP